MCTARQILSDDQIGKVDKGRSLWHTWDKRINMRGFCGRKR